MKKLYLFLFIFLFIFNFKKIICDGSDPEPLSSEGRDYVTPQEEANNEQFDTWGRTSCMFQETINEGDTNINGLRFIDLSPLKNLPENPYIATGFYNSPDLLFSICGEIKSSLCDLDPENPRLQSCARFEIISGIETIYRYTGNIYYHKFKFFDNGITIQHQSNSNNSNFYITNYMYKCNKEYEFNIDEFYRNSDRDIYYIYISTKYACSNYNRYLYKDNLYDFRPLILKSTDNPYTSNGFGSTYTSPFYFNVLGQTKACNTFFNDDSTNIYYGCQIFRDGGPEYISNFSNPIINFVNELEIKLKFVGTPIPNNCDGDGKPSVDLNIKCGTRPFEITSINHISGNNCSIKILVRSNYVCPSVEYISQKSGDVLYLSPYQNIKGGGPYIVSNNTYSYLDFNFGIPPKSCNSSDIYSCKMNDDGVIDALGNQQGLGMGYNYFHVATKSYNPQCNDYSLLSKFLYSINCGTGDYKNVTTSQCNNVIEFESPLACTSQNSLYFDKFHGNYIDLSPLSNISEQLRKRNVFDVKDNTFELNLGGGNSKYNCGSPNYIASSCFYDESEDDDKFIAVYSFESQSINYLSNGIEFVYSNDTATKKSGHYKVLKVQIICDDNIEWTFKQFKRKDDPEKHTLVIAHSKYACRKTINDIYSVPPQPSFCTYVCTTQPKLTPHSYENSVTKVLLDSGICPDQINSYSDYYLSSLFSSTWSDNQIYNDWKTGPFYNNLISGIENTMAILSKFFIQNNSNYCLFKTDIPKSFNDLKTISIDLRIYFVEHSQKYETYGDYKIFFYTDEAGSVKPNTKGIAIVLFNERVCGFNKSRYRDFNINTISLCSYLNTCDTQCENQLPIDQTKKDLNSTLQSLGVCQSEIDEYDYDQMEDYFNAHYLFNRVPNDWTSGQFYEIFKPSSLYKNIGTLRKYVTSDTSEPCTYNTYRSSSSIEQIVNMTSDIFQLAINSKNTKKSYNSMAIDTYFIVSDHDSNYGLSIILFDSAICSFVESTIDEFNNGTILNSCPVAPIFESIEIQPNSNKENQFNLIITGKRLNGTTIEVGETKCNIKGDIKQVGDSQELKCVLPFMEYPKYQYQPIYGYNEYTKKVYKELSIYNDFNFNYPQLKITQIIYSSNPVKYNSTITIFGQNFINLTGIQAHINNLNVTNTIGNFRTDVETGYSTFTLNAIGVGLDSFLKLTCYNGSSLIQLSTSGAENGFSFEQPIIKGLSKTSGDIGDIITIYGENFATSEYTTVYFGFIQVIPLHINNTDIILTVPGGYLTSQISIHSTNLVSLEDVFFKYPNPVINEVFIPKHEFLTPGDNPIWIIGKNMGSETSFIPYVGYGDINYHVECSIQFCDLNGSEFDDHGICKYIINKYPNYFIDHYDLYNCLLDYGIGKNISFQVIPVEGGEIFTYNYSYLPPFIESLEYRNSSFSTDGGSLLNLQGFNYPPTEVIFIGTGNDTLKHWYNDTTISIIDNRINSLSNCMVKDISNIDSTSLNCIIPPGIGSNLKVNIKVGDQDNSWYGKNDQALFSYSPPILNTNYHYSVSTSGNDVITIIGNNFIPVGLSNYYNDPNNLNSTFNSILINDQLCSDLKWINSTSAQCAPLAGSGINLSVGVLVGGQKSKAEPLLSYKPPSITSISPNYTITNNSPILVTIKGNNFSNSGPEVVYIGNKKCENVQQSPSKTTLICESPMYENPTIVNVVASVGNQNSTSNIIFTYYDSPVINEIRVPHLVSVNGKDLITIIGNGFIENGISIDSLSVNFNSTQLPVESVTMNKITFYSKGGVGKNIPIYVEINGYKSNVSTSFAYSDPFIVQVEFSNLNANKVKTAVIKGLNLANKNYTNPTITILGASNNQYCNSIKVYSSAKVECTINTDVDATGYSGELIRTINLAISSLQSNNYIFILNDDSSSDSASEDGSSTGTTLTTLTALAAAAGAAVASASTGVSSSGVSSSIVTAALTAIATTAGVSDGATSHSGTSSTSGGSTPIPTNLPIPQNISTDVYCIQNGDNFNKPMITIENKSKKPINCVDPEKNHTFNSSFICFDKYSGFKTDYVVCTSLDDNEEPDIFTFTGQVYCVIDSAMTCSLYTYNRSMLPSPSPNNPDSKIYTIDQINSGNLTSMIVPSSNSKSSNNYNLIPPGISTTTTTSTTNSLTCNYRSLNTLDNINSTIYYQPVGNDTITCKGAPFVQNGNSVNYGYNFTSSFFCFIYKTGNTILCYRNNKYIDMGSYVECYINPKLFCAYRITNYIPTTKDLENNSPVDNSNSNNEIFLSPTQTSFSKSIHQFSFLFVFLVMLLTLLK